MIPALTMVSPLSAIVRRPPLTAPLEATVRQALEAMMGAGVASLVVADPVGGAPLGLFTLRDLVQRVTLPGGSLEQPVAAVMTGGPITLEPDTPAHQAALVMAHHHVNAVLVVDGAGRLTGLVSREDLFGLSRAGVDEVSERILAAPDQAALRLAAEAGRAACDGLLAQGASVETLGHFLATLDDLVTIRAIELATDQHDPPGVPMCWLALGSEGRLEQTFATDQDNALVFDAPAGEAEEVREALLPFARAVNRTLDACGVPRCAGNVMAGNPRWCLSLDEWRDAFQAWIEVPDPEALVAACTAFDFRPVHGQVALAGRLRDRLRGLVAGRPIFLQHLAEHALATRPPLGTLRDFAFDDAREHGHSLDLKLSGTRLFTDAARVLGLKLGVAHTSTAARLRAVGETGWFGAESVSGLVDGFHFIHRLRLRNQRTQRRPGVGPNRVYPDDLNELDRQVLKEALRQARKLQGALELEYRHRA